MTDAFTTVAFPLLSGESGLIHNPDTVDDIFRLCARLVNIIYISIIDYLLG